MEVKEVRPYSGTVGEDGLVTVYDITVAGTHNYCAPTAVVSNSKRVSLLDLNALLAHQAPGVIQDAKLVRGQKNEEFWLPYMQGFNPPQPKIPMVYDKFVNELRAAGINVVENGPRTNIMALTDKDIAKLAGEREVKTGDTVEFHKNMAPIAGGLFDETIFGKAGTPGRWGKITLHEPMPNPVMEDPIRRVLGLTEAQFLEVLAGRRPLQNGLTGPAAVQKALASLNVDKEIAEARENIKSGRKTHRDVAIRKLGYLKASKELKIHPSEWMLKSAPVLPPVFRPISVMGTSNLPLVTDSNYLYSELIEANNNLKTMSKEVDDVGDERLALYNSFKAVTGLGDPVHPKLVEKKVQGFLAKIFGDGSPKRGTFQRRLLSNTADLTGRGVIMPDKSLDMDSLGVPENTAWEIYKPFIVRQLKRRGMPMLEALQQIDKRSALAKDVLLKEMEVRPVIANRAPVLHKYGILAFKPVLTTGSSLRVSPLVVKPFGADFDGNCCVFSTKITLDLSPRLLYLSPSGRKFFKLLDEGKMLAAKSKFSYFMNELSITTEIGKLPRIGQPVKDKNGADVYRVPRGVYICSYDHASGKVVRQPIRHLTIEQNCECSLVTTTRGRTVEVSNNASLAVFDIEDGNLAKMSPADSVGKLVPYVKCEPIRGCEFDRDIGWWYGALICDGWVQRNTIGYSKNDSTKRAEFIRIARSKIHDNFMAHEYFDDGAAKDKYAASAKIHLNGKELPDKVFNCYGVPVEGGRGALYKRIPEELFSRGNRECLLGLLSGFLDGDKTLGWNMATGKPRAVCRQNTSSKQLVDDLLRLGRMLGIRASVTVTPARNQSQESYAISWSVVDMSKIAHELTLVGADGKEWQEKFAEVPVSKDNIDIVPVPSALIAPISTLLNRKQPTLYSTVRKARKDGHIGRGSARRLVALVDGQVDHPLWESFKRVVANEAVHWDKVESAVLTGSQEVFDFEIPDTKVFMISNGLIIYDTMQLHVPVAEKAVSEAWENMLPSHNLFSPADMKSPNYSPLNEQVGGLYHLSTAQNKRRPHIFGTKKDALAAIKRGDVDLGDPIEIMNG